MIDYNEKLWAASYSLFNNWIFGITTANAIVIGAIMNVINNYHRFCCLCFYFTSVILGNILDGIWSSNISFNERQHFINV